jgi:hypothetical protein
MDSQLQLQLSNLKREENASNEIKSFVTPLGAQSLMAMWTAVDGDAMV